MRILMTQFLRSKGKNTRTITQIGEKEYLVETKSNWARFGCQCDTSVITSAKLENGTHLMVNDSFLGEGKIATIQNIDTEKEGCIILKVSLY
jgi:hypothetical protein